MKKTILRTILCSLLLTSCVDNSKQRIYNWETTIEVRYGDGTKDTITTKGNYRPYLTIKTKENGFFLDTKLVPCITSSLNSYTKGINLACDVRRFKVLSQKKY